MPGVIIRGDLSRVSIQRYCYISEDVVIRPSYTASVPIRYIPLQIGKYTTIGKNSVIQSACIGQGCQIGENCVLSPRSILKDYVKVEPNSVVPPDMVIPPFAIVGGCPARIIGEVSESRTIFAEIDAKARFKMFKAI
jgi:dynactin-5